MMQHYPLNPVATPRVSSRREAWLAWKASNLGKESRVLKTKSSAFSKEFNHALRVSYSGRLKYFVHDVRPNRGEVKLLGVDGDAHWVKLVNVDGFRPPADIDFNFVIHPDYELYHNRQKELIRRSAVGLNLRYGMNSFSFDLWSEDFLEFEEGFEGHVPVTRWLHYVEVYNDLGSQINYNALRASGSVVSVIYMAAQMHWLDQISILMFTEMMQKGDPRLTNDDCFVLLTLAIGYESQSDAFASYAEGRILNRHFLE